MRTSCKVLTFILLFVLLSPGSSFGQTTKALNEDQASKLKDIGILTGSAKGFELDRVPTRLEAAVLFIRLLGKENEAKKTKFNNPYSDVPAWAVPYVGFMCTKGYSKGVAPKKYGSGQAISASEFTTLILRALGYNDSWGAFDQKYSLEAAWSVGLIDKAYYDGLKTGVFLRDDAVAICYNALNTCLYGKTQRLIGKLVSAGTINKAAAEKAGFNTSDSFYTLQDYGDIEGIPFFGSITAELDPGHGSIYKAGSKAIRYKIDNSKLPEKARGFTKLGLQEIQKTALTRDEITQYVKDIAIKGWVRDPLQDRQGYFSFYCGSNNGWLITLLDSSNNVLAYTLIHFLGVGDNMPDAMSDATYRYEKFDLGPLGGVPFFDSAKIYGLYGSVVPMIERDKLPDSMKGFRKISLGTMSDTKKEKLDKDLITKEVLSGGGEDYSDDISKNVQSFAGPLMLVTISDASGKPLGYCLFHKTIITPQ